MQKKKMACPLGTMVNIANLNPTVLTVGVTTALVPTIVEAAGFVTGVWYVD